MIANRLARLAVGAALGALLAASNPVAAQTPVLKSPPNLTLLWLSTLGVSPNSVTVTQTAGSQITGTVTLLRAAVAPLTVSFSLTGATVNESNVLVGDGNLMPASVVIPAGNSSASFTIYVAKAPSWSSKSFTLTAYYGSERKSASFTVRKQ
ncbi:MAG TPA: hypothetical protein VFV33_17335 [Gemmatimonadaceae bacterium]|nr:hypothetical protein [Gemmatimonadaceae bacterium]